MHSVFTQLNGSMVLFLRNVEFFLHAPQFERRSQMFMKGHKGKSTRPHTVTQTVLCVPLLVFVEDFSHGEGDLRHLFILGVGAHVGACEARPVRLRAGLVVRHRLPLLHRGVLCFIVWKHTVRRKGLKVRFKIFMVEVRQQLRLSFI